MPSALTVTFVQSTILNAIANICAQLIDQRKSPVRSLPFLKFPLISINQPATNQDLSFH
jgi:hypothetical protein